MTHVRRKNILVILLVSTIVVLVCRHSEMIPTNYLSSILPERDKRSRHFRKIKNTYENCIGMISNERAENPSSVVVHDPEVIILVNSKVDDYESRCAIRAVWFHYAPKQLAHIMSYVVYFQVGYKDEDTLKQAEHENKLYKDLFIYKNITEIYSNIGAKLRASLTGINRMENLSLKFIVKTDDDVYVSIEKYLVHLKTIMEVDVDYEGLLLDLMPVVRNKKHKNYEPSETIVKDIFPPYCTGYGYVIRATKLDCLVSAFTTYENLKNSDTNVGYLLQFCNTTMKNNDHYGFDSWHNENINGGIALLQKKTPFYFMHGIKKYEQLLFDEFHYNQHSNQMMSPSVDVIGDLDS